VKTDKPREWFRITNKAESRTAEVDIFDTIGSWYGVTAKDLAAQLAALDVDDIHLRVNSPGGDVFDGLAIMNALRQHKASVHADVIGLAASAASYIAVGGADDVHMSPGSMLMIHDASGLVWGNAQDMHETGDLLDKISDNIASLYAKKAGGTLSGWRGVMREERWYTAEEAVSAGLADEAEDAGVAEEAAPTDELRSRVYASAAGGQRAHSVAEAREVAAQLGIAADTPTNQDLPATPGQETINREEAPVEELLKGLCARLGMTETVDQAAVMEALDQRLAAPNIPDDVVPVDKAVYDDMQAELAAGREAVAQATAQRRDGLLADALKAGKVTAASADLWRAQLDANEDGTAALLAAMPANAVPVEMVGYTGGADEASDDETTLYNKAWGTSPAEGK